MSSDRHRSSDGEGEQADQNSADNSLASGWPTAQAQMAGDDDGDPNDSDDEQSNGCATQGLGIDSVRKQALTVECCIDHQREEGCGEEAEDDAADDPASACDQPQPGDGGPSDGVDNGAAEAVRPLR